MFRHVWQRNNQSQGVNTDLQIKDPFIGLLNAISNKTTQNWKYIDSWFLSTGSIAYEKLSLIVFL